ncbi:MAG: sigma-54-dependent Fis family transcriptional regulator [Phycisphaerae bacterium]|nr:sigma-54-dependent Fis family transcriptional regulator [Phycisphaerae bacterium]
MSQQKMTVMVVDDEPLKRITLQLELSEAEYEVLEAADAQIALRLLEGKSVDVVVSDLRMPGMDGIAFLDELKRRSPETDVILMTAYGTVDTAVDAMKRGAYDYITKPFRTEVLLEKLDRLATYRSSGREDAESPEASLGRLVGGGHRMRQLFEQIRVAAAGDEPVLVIGEPGTGKTTVAETIHELSSGRGGAIVRLNCETLTEHTAMAELFGTASSVSGAHRPGRIEQASAGTLLIENVDRLSPAIQTRLAQVLETGQIDLEQARIAVEARIISTTKASLLDIVRRGEFREDLYYRLSVRTLTLPAMRDRREDIAALTRRFVAKHAILIGPAASDRIDVSPHAMDLLASYHWPGNVLELEHAIEQALTRCGGEEIRPEHLPASVTASDPSRMAVSVPEVGLGLNQTVADVERTLIEAALKECAGNQAQAAQVLRIPRTTLRDKMTKYGMVGEAR